MTKINIDGINVLCDIIDSDLTGKVVIVKIMNKIYYKEDFYKIESVFSKFAKDSNAKGILAIPYFADINIANIDDSIKSIDECIYYLNKAKDKIEKMRDKQ